jgi:hypothetical protein
MRKLLLGALFLSSALVAGASARAATLADVSLPDKIEAAGQPLVLNGLGLRKKFFVKVYVGGLYLPARQSSAATMMADDTTRRMVLHFVYSVSSAQMCDAWNEALAANTPAASAEVKAGFHTLCGAMEDIPSGSELVMTYIPGKGTLIEVASKMKGTIPGKATADAILATWIGPHPGPGDDFKKAVLGGGH